MKKLVLLLFLTSNFQPLTSKADNTGQINGTVTDSISGEPLVGATVQVMLNGTAFGTVADINGYYVLKPLQPGLYDVRISYIGYSPTTVTGVHVSQGSIKILNVRLSLSSDMNPVVITGDKYELISVEPRAGYFSPNEMEHAPVRGTKELVATLPGVYQSDSGGELYFRGSRPEATEYYIDNMRVTGELGIPAGAIAEIMVYSGGIPARYGDVTGGVVVITTKSYNMYHE
ncbi:MAG: carboxypeptidase regulatory-like domain-containing protein [Bacteroidia bacterium]